LPRRSASSRIRFHRRTRNFDQKKFLAEAILTEGTNAAQALIKQREAVASAGGETQIQLAFATNLLGKRIIMNPHRECG